MAKAKNSAPSGGKAASTSVPIGDALPRAWLPETILDALPEPAAVFTPEGVFVYANAAWLKRVNLRLADIRGKAPWDISGTSPGMTPQQSQRINAQIVASGRPLTMQRAINYPGGVFNVQVTYTPLPDPDSGTTLILATSRDLSQLHDVEDTLRQRNKYLAALHETTLALIQQTDIHAILQTILEQARALFNADEGFISLVDPDQAALVQQFGVGGEERDNGRVQPLNMGLAGRAYQSGQLEITDDYASWPGRWQKTTRKRAAAALPLKEGERVVGALGLAYHDPARRFDPEALPRLQQFGRLAELAFFNTRLHERAQVEIAKRQRAEEQLKQQNEHLATLHEVALSLLNERDSQKLFDLILRRAADVVGSKHGYVDVLSDDRKHVVMRAASGRYVSRLGATSLPDRGAEGQAWRERLTLAVDDYQAYRHRREGYDWLRTSVSVPLLLGDEVAGILGLAFEQVVDITPQQIDMLDRLGRLAALALHNVRLHESAQTELAEHQRAEQRLKQQNEYLATLHEVTLSLLNQRDSQSVLQLILNQAGAMIGTTHGFIDIVEPDRSSLKVAFATGSVQPAIGMLTGYGEALSGRAWKRRSLQLVRDYQAFKRKRSGFDWARTALCVPLLADDEVIGVIGLAFETVVDIGPEQFDSLERLGRLAALAIHNAHLYEAAQREIAERFRAEQAEREQRLFAETLRDAASALNSSLKLDDVLDAILANVERIKPGAPANIMLIEDGMARVARYRGYDALRGIWDAAHANFRIDDVPIARRMAQSGKPVAIPDTMNDPNWIALSVKDRPSPIRGFVGAPIRVDGKVIGFLNLDLLAPHACDQQDAERLLAFADQCALAIKNARLYEQSQVAAVLEDRQRLARDIHDNVSQILFSATMISGALPRLWDKDMPAIRSGLDELDRMTRGALGELRTLLATLRPDALADADLGELFSQMCAALDAHVGGGVELKFEGERHLPPDIQTAFYWIAREAMWNIARHAQPRRVTVQLRAQSDRAEMVIADDGKGFDARAKRRGHFGVGIMRERAEEIGAEFRVASSIGKGTTISVVWPAPRPGSRARQKD